MPVHYEEGTTPAGHPLLTMHVSGLCSLAEAETLDGYIKPGKKYHRQRVLVYVAHGTTYSPEARKHFPKLKMDHHAMATVVTSTVVRAAINLITRVMGDSRNFRLFNDGAAGLAWLDEVAP